MDSASLVPTPLAMGQVQNGHGKSNITAVHQKYLGVKTGQDLIDLGVIPKDSSTHLALIAAKRLKALRDRALAKINKNMLGEWTPCLDEILKDVGSELDDPAMMARVAKPEMTVRGKANSINFEWGIQDKLGVVRYVHDRPSEPLGVEWQSQPKNGHDLDGRLQNRNGLWVNYGSVKLLAPPGVTFKVVDGYALAKSVVADKKLGHFVRFNGEYSGDAWDRDNKRRTVAVGEGSRGMLIEFEKKGSDEVFVGVNFDAQIDGRAIYYFHAKDISKLLMASSLGQMEPQDKERVLMEQTLNDFFPRTFVDPKRAYRVAQAILMGKDVILYGPAGSGKSNLAKDTIDIFKQMGVMFIVEGCQAQCNPYSLFDPSFARVVPPCPECMIKYDPAYKDTGFFHPPKPKDVKVVVAACGEGKGVEFAEGTTNLTRMHLAGYKTPKLDGTTDAARESDFDPAGFHAGMLVRTNNGVLHLDELDKLRPQAHDCLLEALNSDRTKPDQLRFPYPADSVIIATANDPTKFSDPLIDRMALLAIRYPDSPEVNHRITLGAYHGQWEPAEAVPVGDTHHEPGKILRSVPMPVIIEMAVEQFYLKFRAEYKGEGKTEIMESNRSKLDAFDAARAALMLDQLWKEKAPAIVDIHYAGEGIKYALCTRVRSESRDKDQATKRGLSEWVDQKLPEFLKAEEDTWWCTFFQHIATAKTQVPQIEANAITELNLYRETPLKVVQLLQNYQAVQEARMPGATIAQERARIMHPVMDYLFQQQPGMVVVNPKQLEQLIGYFIKSSENSKCKLQ